MKVFFLNGNKQYLDTTEQHVHLSLNLKHSCVVVSRPFFEIPYQAPHNPTRWETVAGQVHGLVSKFGFRNNTEILLFFSHLCCISSL